MSLPGNATGQCFCSLEIYWTSFCNTWKEVTLEKWLPLRLQPAAATEASSLQMEPLLHGRGRPRCQMMPCCTPTSSYITQSDAAHTHKSTHFLAHVHERSHCRPPSACTHTPAGQGTAKTQESCGLINYHLKETKVDVS